ncbi:MAG: hypothetical protein Q8933_10125 [Bacteroidota bacterium]|nr:hypothetical protein [Bacteroidota bacterium]
MTLQSIKSGKESLWGAIGSVLFHMIVLISAILLLKLSGSGEFSSSGYGYYVEIGSVKGALGSNRQENEDKGNLLPKTDPISEKINDEEDRIKENKKDLVKLTPKDSRSEVKTSKPLNPGGTSSGASGGYQNIESAGFDTSSLGQFYREPTLNVRMPYPQGWVYVDQQKKKKLDGITFWASGSNFNPPPYIHVEVVDKYLFNPDQYKYKYDFEHFTGFYNEPVELENQVSQVIYLRTEDDKDFTIKLIMGNPAAFKQFQPVFFAIVKSFKFGSSFFWN